MKTLFVGFVFLVSGCASSTGVVPTGPDSYMVSLTAGTGSVSTGPVLADAYKEAGDFCDKNGKKMEPVHSQTVPMYFGHRPEAQLDFMCLDSGDSQLQRPMMHAEQGSSGPAPASAPIVQPFMSIPTVTFTPVPFTPMKTPTQTHCASNRIGNQVYTNCSGY